MTRTTAQLIYAALVDSPLGRLDDLDRAAAIRELVELLGHEQRNAVVAAVLGGASWQQVGDALGTSRQSAHKTYARAVDAGLRDSIRRDVVELPGQVTVDELVAAADDTAAELAAVDAVELGDDELPSCTYGATGWCQQGKHRKCAHSDGGHFANGVVGLDGHRWRCACVCHDATRATCSHPSHDQVDDVAAAVDELVVVVPCSADKLDHAAPAGQLYTGQLHRSARRAADALVAAHHGPARIVVLSARHGLVGLDDVLAPYDTTWGDADAVTVDQLAVDVERIGTGARWVSLMPATYTGKLAAARGCELDAAPIVGLRIGVARGVLRQLAAGELAL